MSDPGRKRGRPYPGFDERKRSRFLEAEHAGPELDGLLDRLEEPEVLRKFLLRLRGRERDWDDLAGMGERARLGADRAYEEICQELEETLDVTDVQIELECAGHVQCDSTWLDDSTYYGHRPSEVQRYALTVRVGDETMINLVVTMDFVIERVRHVWTAERTLEEGTALLSAYITRRITITRMLNLIDRIFAEEGVTNASEELRLRSLITPAHNDTIRVTRRDEWHRGHRIRPNESVYDE